MEYHGSEGTYIATYSGDRSLKNSWLQKSAMAQKAYSLYLAAATSELWNHLNEGKESIAYWLHNYMNEMMDFPSLFIWWIWESRNNR